MAATRYRPGLPADHCPAAGRVIRAARRTYRCPGARREPGDVRRAGRRLGPGSRGRPGRGRGGGPRAAGRLWSRRVEKGLDQLRVVDGNPAPGAVEHEPDRTGRPLQDHRVDDTGRRLRRTLQPQRGSPARRQRGGRPGGIRQRLAVPARAVRLDADPYPSFGVDQPRGTPGQHRRPAHQRLKTGPRLGEPIEVADDPHGGTGVRIQRGQAPGQLFHKPMVRHGTGGEE